jgi:divalent metal cation (Fe/Co/Zn/Cd) transporter
LPFLAVTLFFAVMGRSLILYVDVVTYISFVAQMWIAYAIFKKLEKKQSFEYDYGLGKFESFGGLTVNFILYIGYIVIIVFSAFAFFDPEEPDSILFWAIFYKILVTLFDGWTYLWQVRAVKAAYSKLGEAQKRVFLDTLIFDLVSLAAISCVYIFHNLPIIGQLEAGLCVAYSVFSMVLLVKPLKQCAYDLLDKTSDEDIQLKIMKALAKGHDLYDAFHAVRTRSSGQTIYIDLLIGFSNEKKYSEINDSFDTLEALVTKEVPNSIVSVVLTKNN